MVNRLLFLLCLLGVAACELQPTERVQQGSKEGSLYAINNLDRTIVSIDGDPVRQVQVVAVTGDAPAGNTRSGKEFFLACSLSNEIWVYDLENWQLLRRLPCGSPSNPLGVAISGNGEKLWVTNWASNEVLALDPQSGEILHRVPMPAPDVLPRDEERRPTAARPDGILWTSQGVWVGLNNLTQREVVAGGPGLLAQIDPDSGELMGVFTLRGRNPGGIYLDPNSPDLLLIPCRGDFQSGEGFVGNGSLEVWSTTERRTLGSIPNTGAPSDLIFTSFRQAWLNNARTASLVEVDLFGLRLSQTLDLPSQNFGETSYLSDLSEDGADGIWLTEFNSGTLWRFNPETETFSEGPITLGSGPTHLFRIARNSAE